MSETDYNV